MNKNVILLAPLALLALAGCSSNADTGDSGIEIHQGSNKASSNNGPGSVQNNPNVPQSAKDAMGGGKK